MKSSVKLNVRFSDTDAMGVVWHGNYLHYFEDVRDVFGREHGLDSLEIYEKGFFTPIVKADIDYKSPIFYGDEIEVETVLVQTPAAKIIHEYTIYNRTTNKVSATGMTIQVFLNSKSRSLELTVPDFYAEWKQNHQS